MKMIVSIESLNNPLYWYPHGQVSSCLVYPSKKPWACNSEQMQKWLREETESQSIRKQEEVKQGTGVLVDFFKDFFSDHFKQSDFEWDIAKSTLYPLPILPQPPRLEFSFREDLIEQ